MCARFPARNGVPDLERRSVVPADDAFLEVGTEYASDIRLGVGRDSATSCAKQRTRCGATLETASNPSLARSQIRLAAIYTTGA